MKLEVIIIAVACFLLGLILGGILIYVAYLKRFHAEGVDEILSCVERLDGNMQKLNANVKQAVGRFGSYSDGFERQMVDLNGSLARSSEASLNAFKHLDDGIVALKSVSGEIQQDVGRVLERVKLME